MYMERLDKFLCDSGAGTRSQVKALLKSGRVTVDGKVEKDNGRKIDPKYEGYIHGAGMVLLLGLMAIIMFKDIFVIMKG